MVIPIRIVLIFKGKFRTKLHFVELKMHFVGLKGILIDNITKKKQQQPSFYLGSLKMELPKK
jgi:hypothetical protein